MSDKLWRQEMFKAIRARDGDDCYRCDGPIDFDAEPGSDWAPSIEHKKARTEGGDSKLPNLAISHVWCNSKRTTEVALRQEAAKRRILRRGVA